MDTPFSTAAGEPVPAVTAAQMREVDRIAIQAFDIDLLQMMENAGRTLAEVVIQAYDPATVAVVAGGGGNGGGGLCAARHLHNHGVDVRPFLDRSGDALEGAPARQCRTLRAMGLEPAEDVTIGAADVVVDALIGYGLSGPVTGRARRWIEAINRADVPVVALDVPSGRDATTGEVLGAAVAPTLTLALALPKRGLADVPDDIVLGDIGLPAGVFERAGIGDGRPFDGSYRLPLRVA